jgi:hypothetical protein
LLRGSTAAFEAALSSRLLDVVRWLDAVGCAWCPRVVAREMATPNNERRFAAGTWPRELADWIASQSRRPCGIAHGCCTDGAVQTGASIHQGRTLSAPAPAFGIGQAYYRETAAAIAGADAQP